MSHRFILMLSRLNLAGALFSLVLLFVPGFGTLNAQAAAVQAAAVQPSSLQAGLYEPLVAFTCDDVTEIPVSECQALVALYDATGGPNWMYKLNWKQTVTPCTWSRVTCDNGHVTMLNLRYGDLQGRLPSELGNLPELTKLYLNNNYLFGSIPPELGRLTKLTYLDLSQNSLTGSIPPELGQMKAMVSLYLGHNQLSGPIPATLGDLPHLETLYLVYNQLSGPIPPALSKATALGNLGLGSNQLTGTIPSELASLPVLGSLNLGYNQLSGGIPSQLGQLTNLNMLSLSGNDLSGPIPPELGNLPKLVYLGLSGNALSGGIPAELGNLAQLGELDVQYNQLTGPVPAALGSLTSLFRIDLSHNHLSGSLPAELAGLSKLNYLGLHSNMLTGEVPAAWANLITTSGKPNISLSFNGVTASDPSVIELLNYGDYSWSTTQTVPPANLTVGAVTSNSAELHWNPIPYQADAGYYQVELSTSQNGPYKPYMRKTSDKAADHLLIEWLTPATTYYACVRTFTPAHPDQQNDLLSACSAPVKIQVLEGEPALIPLYLPTVRR